jgi:NTE family protein
MTSLGVSSKMNAEMDFLEYLFALGRETGEAWIAAHWENVGVKGTWLPREVFEESLQPAHLAKGTERASNS